MNTRHVTLTLTASALLCAAGCSEPRTMAPVPVPPEAATHDISGEYFMLRHGYTSAEETVPFASDIASVRFSQSGNVFEQSLLDDPESMPIPGTVSGSTYRQGDSEFDASFTMTSASSGSGMFDGFGITFDFELARREAPAFDITGDFDGSGGGDVRLDLTTGNTVEATIGGTAYSGVQTGATAFLLPRAPDANSSGAAVIQFETAERAEVTVYAYRWRPLMGGHRGFARGESSFRIVREGSEPTCTAGATAVCLCTDGLSGTQTCSADGVFGACDCAPEPPVDPVDCRVTDFGEWSACSAECGGGTRTRTRRVAQAAERGGAACPELEESEACNPQACVTSYYQVVRESMTWDQARDYAATLSFGGVHGHLVTIQSAEEQAHVAELMRDAGGAVWLGAMQTGATETTPRTSWMWVTGEPMEYDNFAPGEPNDGIGDEDYLMGWGNGTWNDARTRDNTAGFIVEYEVSSGNVADIMAVETSTGIDFYGARDAASLWSREGQRGSLADIDSDDEQASLETALASIGARLNFWIGGWQYPGYAPAERWHRMDGSSKSYFNWFPGEPNDASGPEDYLLTFPNGQWIDTNAGGYDVGGYIVKF